MRTIIEKSDIINLQGRFIVQLNIENPYEDVSVLDHDGFWLEKRIGFVTRLDLVGNDYLKKEHQKEGLVVVAGMYYCQGIYTLDEFVEIFNLGYKGKGKRFYRLMTDKELDWLNSHLKKTKNF